MHICLVATSKNFLGNLSNDQNPLQATKVMNYPRPRLVWKFCYAQSAEMAGGTGTAY